MFTLTKYLLFITLLAGASFFEIKINTGNNYTVTLLSNDPVHPLEDYCVARFIRRNENGEGEPIDQLIKGKNEISMKMDWLTPGMFNDVCFHRDCDPLKEDQPICKKFTLPSLLSCDTNEKSIKLNFEPSQPSANEFEVILKFNEEELSRKIIKVPIISPLLDGLSSSSNYSLIVKPVSKRRSDYWTVSYELNCTTKQGDLTVTPAPMSTKPVHPKLDELTRTVERLSIKINIILGLLVSTLLTLLVSIILNFVIDFKIKLRKKKYEGNVQEQEGLNHSPSKSSDSSWVTSGGSFQSLGRLGTGIRFRKAEKNEQDNEK